MYINDAGEVSLFNDGNESKHWRSFGFDRQIYSRRSSSLALFSFPLCVRWSRFSDTKKVRFRMNDEKRCFHSIRSAIHFPSLDIDCLLNAIVYPLCLFRRFIDIDILLTIPNAFPYRQLLKEDRRVSLQYSKGSTRLFILSYCLSYRFLFFDKIDT